MQPRRLRPALLAALAALLFAAGALAPSRTSIAEASEEPPEGETITTVLHPGWNMVGWVGPTASVVELLDEVEALRVVATQDATTHEYVYAWPERHDDFPAIAPGMGLWLYLSGDSPVRWTRPGVTAGLVHRLDAGQHFVGVLADGAVTPPADAEAQAWRWDPVQQGYEPYRFGDATLSGGEALWIEAAAPFNLWQPGTQPPPFIFLGAVPVEDRRAILGEYENVRRFFAEHFAVAIRGRLHYVGADVEAIRPLYFQLVGYEPPEGFCGQSAQGVRLVLVRCGGRPGVTLDHGYVSELVVEVPGRGVPRRGEPTLDPRGPGWLIAGTRQYALEEYRGGPSNRQRLNLETGVGRILLPLSYFEVTENRDGDTNFSARALGFFAVEWLAERAGNPAVFDYFRLVRTSEDWRKTFETAFGIDADDFYREFATYRAVEFLPPPRLGDDAVRPVVVFTGDVPVETRRVMTTELDGIYTTLTERFGADPFEYTFYVGMDKQSLRQVIPPLGVGDWLNAGEASCSYVHAPRSILMLTLRCFEAFPDILHWYLLEGALAQLAPVGSLPPTEEDRSLRGPMWLQIGTELYTRHEYLEAAGETPYRLQTEFAFARRWAPQPLRSMETISAINAARDQAEAPGFLAVEWLAEYAGEPAIFEYYRVLPSSTSWQTAFEQAFGLTIEDFYARFAAYRAELGAQ